MMLHKDFLKKFDALIKGASDSATRDLLEKLQSSLAYCLEENAVLREVLQDRYHCKSPRLTSEQKKRLGRRALHLGKPLLDDVARIYRPDTVLGWYRDLIGKKYDRHGGKGKKPGPPMIPQEYRETILRIARRNPEWGYQRIAAYMAYLKMKVSASTVKRVLLDYGIIPDPEKKKHMDWQQFLDSHRDVIAATDFCTAEVLEDNHLTRHHILIFIDIKTRKVSLGGIRHDPNEPWMLQVARNQTDCFDGFLNGKRYLIHDRDTLFTGKFRKLLKESGIQCKKIRARTPDMNAYAERFVQTIQQECLDKLILTSEKQLWHVVNEYILYYNHERPHQGLGGGFIEPWPQDEGGEIMEFQRLGGLLKSYRRVKVPFSGHFTIQAAPVQDLAA
jgi:transposase InsO family protein